MLSCSPNREPTLYFRSIPMKQNVRENSFSLMVINTINTFSLSPSKKATMSTFCGFFLHFLLNKFIPFDEFFPLQNAIASVGVCACVHPKNKDVSQAIIGTFFSVHFTKDGRMGCSEVCHRFMLKFKPQTVKANVSFYLIAILALHVKYHPYRKGMSQEMCSL